MIIDAHAHVGHGRYKSLDPDDLLRQMDAHGIDRAVICPVEEQIVLHNREGNDYILAQARRRPTRFIGFAVANPWYGPAAVAELERALSEGLRGLKLHPVIQGFAPNDPIVFPLIEAAGRRRAPVYVHTGAPNFGEPLELVELARRYPEVTFLMGHSGASDFWGDVPLCHRFAPNILFESSRNGPANFAYLCANIGADWLVFGSNAPESLYEVELANLRDAISEPAELAQVLAGNLARVLGEAPA
jgi:predicted TIM-barrel fold metal-dependent hydrolase